MKKLLLASTALVLSAGLAHAQAVTITGEGRMGVQYDSFGFAGSNWRQENRLTLNFNVSVQADHGLAFGAWTRARMSVTGQGTALGNGFSGSRVWVQANNFRLTFGNQDGAIRGAGTAMGYAGGCGIGYEGGIQCWDAAGLLSVSHAQNSTGDDNEPMVRADYTFGSTRIAVSHARGGSTELGVRTTFDAFTVAFGYTNDGGASSAGEPVYTLSGRYNAGAWGAAVLVAHGNSVTNWSLQGNVQLGGGNLYGYIGEINSRQSYGVNYGYGLGGGATLHAGVERLEGTAIIPNRTVGSVGVVFTF